MTDGRHDRDGPSAADSFRQLDADESPRPLPPEPGRWARLRASLWLYLKLALAVAVIAFLAGLLVVQIRARVLEQVDQVDPAPGQSVGSEAVGQVA
ncbi:MAG: hypothetical protein ACRDUY_08870 [Nitriliruptorales bacterium]